MPPSPSAGILHVDLDAFYAAVEVLVDPALAGKPLVVGGTGGRGVVAAASYEARVYGINSAMPTARARRLCPHAVFVPGNYGLYSDYSRRLHVIFRSVTPLVEGIALDEAFLDVSGARRLLGEPPAIARDLRQRIRDELGLWASVGVATTKMIAKMASEAAKPRVDGGKVRPGLGVKVVEPGRELEFLHPQPVRALWGVGPATARRLDRFGVVTVADLAALPAETLTNALGPALGRHLHDLAWARDARPVEPARDARSIGHEETYARDHHEREALAVEVVRLSDAVAARLRSAGLAGRTITLKVRFGDFRTITRSRTVPEPIANGPEVARVAKALLDGVDPTPGVRLLGVSASNLIAPPALQLALAERPEASSPWEGVGAAVEEVRKRFGDEAVGPAALLPASGRPAWPERRRPAWPERRRPAWPERRDGLRLRRMGDQQWGPSD